MSEHSSVPLTNDEIQTLEANGCRAENWAGVKVAPGFNPQRFRNVIFEGTVEIGKLAGDVRLPDGTQKQAGIDNALLRNVSVGDGCYISHVHIGLVNLNIEANVAIENVGEIVCNGETTFGNGHAIEVLNEGGGRELKICKNTSAQIAYMTVLYRSEPDLVAALNRQADAFAEGMKSKRGIIRKGAYIKNSTQLVNMYIGEYAVIDGATSLRDSTIDSSVEAPTFIGNGVIVEKSIIQKGASVKDGAMLTSSLIGESTRVGKQASLENSVLFANSECFHSEVCSVFGGPYTVTHHRSTLLIAGLFSFYNAGSATNQSNHMYKLGPVHQGILERGCKTGSSSYLLWPSRAGAFSAILGKHYANFDTSDFPFSYISDEGGKSVIIPAMNYFTTGTFRDAIKWPKRDRREGAEKLDLIHFEVLSPFTMQKVIRAQDILATLGAQAEKSQTFVSYKNIHIKRLLLKTCKRYYQLILEKYLGDVMVKRIEQTSPASFAGLFSEQDDPKLDEWVDMCGLICPKTKVNDLIRQIIDGTLATTEAVQQALANIHSNYADDEWQWFLALYEHLYQRKLSDESVENLESLLNRWKTASVKLLNMVMQDAAKEFEGNVKTGFGIDGDGDRDFRQVRGSFDDNSFKKQIEQDIESVQQRFESVLAFIRR